MKKSVTLVAPGRFHMVPLATEFARSSCLGAVHIQSRFWAVPEDLPKQAYHNDWWGAVWGKLASRMGNQNAMDLSRANFARKVADHLASQPPGILHGWNGVMHQTFHRLQGTGWLRCVERSCPHNLFQYEILREEGERLGVPHMENLDQLKRNVEELYLADVIAVPSSYSASSYRDPELVAKVRVNTLGSNYRYVERARVPDGKFRVLMVGNDFLRKGSHYLIEAFRLLDMPDGELVIRGHVPAAYRSRLRDPRVRIVGELPADRLRGLYAQADVFVQPSIDEGFGMTVLEALAYGLPVVVTENVGCRDLLNDKVSRTVPIRDPEALAHAILAARQLSGGDFDRERKAILERNSWRACAERMLNTVYTAPTNRCVCHPPSVAPVV